MNKAEKIYREEAKKRMSFLDNNRVNGRSDYIFETAIAPEDTGEILRKVKVKRLLMGIKSRKEFNKKNLTALANFSLMKIRADHKKNNQNVRKGQDNER